MHDKIWANQRRLAADTHGRGTTEVGLKICKFERDMAVPAVEAQIKANMEMEAKLRVLATSSLYIATKSGGRDTPNRANEL